MAKKRRRSAGRAADPKRSGGAKAQGGAAPRRSGAPTEDAALGPRLPWWVPAAVFVGLTLLLFRAFVFGDQMLFGNDTLGLGYVARAFYADQLGELGTVPGWAPLILGGTPFLEALASGDSLYPPSVLLLVLMATHRALGWKLVLHYAAAGFFMFGWLRAIGRSRSAALLGGTAYLLAPYFVSLIQPGHDGKIFVTALAPLLFWAVERHVLRPAPKTVASIALVVGLVILTTHFQMAYFLFGAVGLYAGFRTIERWRGLGEGAAGLEGQVGAAGEGAGDADARGAEGGQTHHGSGSGSGAVVPTPGGPRRARAALAPFALFLGASLLGAGVSAVQLLPAVDYVTEYSRRVQTTREAEGESGAAWSSSWSLHPEEAVAMVIPEFAGNNSGGAAWAQGTYWGRNATKDNHEGTGLVILLLAAVAFAGGARHGLRFFFLGLATLAFLFALGAHTPVWGLLYAVVPGISLFRAPSQVMFLFAFSAATLGAIGLDRVLGLERTGDEEGWKGVTRTLGVATALLALLALLAGSGALTSLWTSAVYQPARPEALRSLEPFIARGAALAFLFGLGTLGAVWALRRAYLAPAGLVAVLVLFVGADEYRISQGFIQIFDFDTWSVPDRFQQTVLDREEGSDEPYRMLSFRDFGQDVKPAMFGIELAAGHHPNDLSRYRELIGMVGSGEPTNLRLSEPIRRLLNVRYVLWFDYAYRLPFPGASETLLASQLADGTLYESLHAVDGLPRARLVGGYVVKSDEEAVPYMLSPAFDPEREVVLPEAPPIALDGLEPEGSVRWVERSTRRLELEVSTERPSLLVVADNWFPAWRPTVDGADTPLLRAYHSLRAVGVPAGTHTVAMEYRSAIVGRSLLSSVLVTLGLLAVLVAEAVRARRPGVTP